MAAPQKVYLLLVCVFFFQSCSDDNEVSPEADPTPIWEEDDRFLFEWKVQYNTHFDGNALHFMGRNHFSTIWLEDTIEHHQHAVQFLEYNQNAKMPISDLHFVTGDQRTVRIAQNAEPVLSGGSVYIHMEELDPEFGWTNYPPFWISDAMATNDLHETLIPYTYLKEDNLVGSRLLKVRITDDLFPQIEETNIFTVPEGGFEIAAIYAFEDFFLIADYRRTYRLGIDNQLVEVSDQSLYRIFTIDNLLYAISDGKLFQSGDGSVWVEVQSDINSQLRLLNFDVVDGKTIAFYNSQLFLFENIEGTIRITELENEGLYGHQITSVASFNSRIYVTTFSGVFHKSTEHFLVEKLEEEEN